MGILLLNDRFSLYIYGEKCLLINRTLLQNGAYSTEQSYLQQQAIYI